MLVPAVAVIGWSILAVVAFIAGRLFRRHRLVGWFLAVSIGGLVYWLAVEHTRPHGYYALIEALVAHIAVAGGAMGAACTWVWVKTSDRAQKSDHSGSG